MGVRFLLSFDNSSFNSEYVLICMRPSSTSRYFSIRLVLYGADNAMWSSDYPHTAAIWPRSRQFIEETFGGVSEEHRRKIVYDTAARLYGID